MYEKDTAFDLHFNIYKKKQFIFYDSYIVYISHQIKLHISMLQTVCINSIEHLFEHISTFARELLTYFTLFRFTVYYRIL
jgi:hypothetical protein